ncbi:MAG: hypothetical protein VYC19_10860 [Pseudomonadota bacterium]|jgi:hypothetical protein|nr:hypothetical protein [Alphaproteobacteria bacterium]MEC7577513.1 hypothetical protein [Pseudomonadota bacterium]MCS5597114.1 hypothetical protein [Alphaproteobacteria bacterium]MEC7703242.1 hypothetical protein [Pseudomonadota bacterium]MEC9236570.1 hypothetical protein [Pseudomonadota bacterium]|tara:strand:+ start:11950 stop:12303 length:354 start_codon:yes stop_codon:yes gene_type:complete
MDIMGLIHDWADVIWIPIAAVSVHKGQRIKAVVFVLFCMATMRLQDELIRDTGYETGYLNFMHSDIFNRAQISYSVFIVLYLILSHYSPNTKGAVYMAASISIYFMAFFTSMFIMLL